jgi:TonB family protein
MLSLAVHICAILLYSFKISFFPDESFLYESAIRVDLVALPDKLSTVPDPPIEAPKEINEPIKESRPREEITTKAKDRKLPVIEPNETTVALEKLKDKKKNAVESAIDKLRKDVAIEKVKGMLKDQKNEDSKPQPTIYKGNILSPGTELTGVNKMDHQDYHTALDRHVKEYWRLPEWVAKANLKTQVRIYLNENGLLVNAKIVKSSGQASYDESVMESVKKASPYPAPPTKFRDIVEVEGILLGFPE